MGKKSLLVGLLGQTDHDAAERWLGQDLGAIATALVGVAKCARVCGWPGNIRKAFVYKYFWMGSHVTKSRAP